ncbi:MAG: hypothetical protein ACYC64_06665 [Armatimonadota bacterium]
MNRPELINTLLSRISELPMIDAHTHLVGGKLGARGLHDILLYHMAVSELYAAGCPNGSRLTQYPGWPDVDEAHSRIREALPYLNYVRNTNISHGIRTILCDLYGWNKEITQDNWQELDDIIRERADDVSWQRKIARRANIECFVTEIARQEDGKDGDILRYALEWGFFTRCQWGEFDTALYELERCWGYTPESQSPSQIGGTRPQTQRVIRTMDDVREATNWYVEHIPFDKVNSMATHIATDIDFRLVSDAQMESALSRRDSAGPQERDIYASYINEIFLTELEKYAESIVFQFSFGAEPLPFETQSRLSQNTIAQMAEIIGRHPKLRFQCLLASRHANQAMCTLARELPNLSLAGYWWHNFYPSSMRQIMSERLEMLPTNRQVGFFSDAYCIEWAYAKAGIVRRQLANVLAEKVEDDYYDLETAVGIAKEILFDTTKSLLRL